jgi:hypothetical protein
MSVCINLLPAEILITRRVAIRRRRWIAASIVLACAGVVASMVVRATLRDPRGLSEELDIQNARLQRAAVDLDAARAALQSADQRLLAVGGLSDRPNWQTLLGLIAQSRTERIAIDIVALRKAAPVAAPAVGTPGASKSPVDDGSFVIAIRGRAEAQLDVTSFALGLERLGLFEAVRQDRLQEVTLGKKALLEFDLVCTLAPSAEPNSKPSSNPNSDPDPSNGGSLERDAGAAEITPGELPPAGGTR